MKNVSWLLFPLSIFWFTACASLRPEAFKSFESSVATAQKGLETEMARDVEWTREADVDALAETKAAPLSDQMLKEAKGYVWSTPVTAPHWEARLTLRALQELNAGFLGYAKLLTRVSEGSPGPEGNNALALAINQSLRDAGESLDKTGRRPTLFPAGVSALSYESLLQVKRTGQSKTLRTVLQENHPWVVAYAAHCLALLDLIRIDLKTAYGDRMTAIQARWDDKRTPGRNTLARSIFNLNAEFADAMESLKALGLFYNQLPLAHQDLAHGLARTGPPQQALAELGAFAERVAQLTKELEKVR